MQWKTFHLIVSGSLSGTSILTLDQFLTNICNIDFIKFGQFLIDHRQW